jgi:hypothetical protein
MNLARSKYDCVSTPYIQLLNIEDTAYISHFTEASCEIVKHHWGLEIVTSDAVRFSALQGDFLIKREDSFHVVRLQEFREQFEVLTRGMS